MVVAIQRKFWELRLKHSAENIETALAQATQKNLSILQTIDRLLDLEIDKRRQARFSFESAWVERQMFPEA